MIFFIRSYVSNYDGKIQKYFKALNTLDIKYKFMGWNRDGSIQNKENEITFNKKGYIGEGFKNLLNLFLWNLFVFSNLMKFKNEIKVVHVIDFDSAVIVFIFCKIYRKKIIFDVYDKYSDTHNIHGFLKRLIDYIEKFIIMKSDICILADETRLKQHNVKKGKNIFIIENVPEESLLNNLDINKNQDVMKFGYFGVLEAKHRGIEDLIESILKSSSCELHIIGYGALGEYVKIKSDNKKIKFYGAMTSKEGLDVMKSMDVIVGMYYKTIENHLFAAPNKYYEHLMLGKAFLTTLDTPPGVKTIKYDTGWAVEEGEDSLNLFLKGLSREDIYLKSNNASALWSKHYENYFNDIYLKSYGYLVKSYLH